MQPDILKVIADNPALLTAVREVIEKHFSLDNIDTSLTNEEMGEVVRAKVDGLKMVSAAFKEIERHKSIEPKVGGVNPAR